MEMIPRKNKGARREISRRSTRRTQEWFQSVPGSVLAAGLLVASVCGGTAMQINEEAWLACQNPHTMLQHIGPEADVAKLRLFGCACLRRVLYLAPSRRSVEAVLAVERHAGGLPGPNNLGVARKDADAAREAFPESRVAAATYLLTLQGGQPTWRRVNEITIQCANVVVEAGNNIGLWGQERAAQADLLRCVFGNPFRPVTRDPAWLAWNHGTVARLGETIHAEGRFVDVPVLGDALEEAGCTDQAILDHCRAATPHTRGCWVVELLRSVS
jgi:hypothetical protein